MYLSKAGFPCEKKKYKFHVSEYFKEDIPTI